MTTDFDRFAPASGPGIDGLIHRLTPTRRDFNGLLFGLCGATITEELPYYAHVNCSDCAATLAGRPSPRD
ncbi:hypothetical protein AB0F77_15215 [Streptomyces sp. NPDC026672]|uniref:hypothetical protein n=1 Tax=unclassified Streptomyces TaxID=2593676 RepID=UPI0033C4D473